jgi:hypothetical protein
MQVPLADHAVTPETVYLPNLRERQPVGREQLDFIGMSYSDECPSPRKMLGVTVF